MPSSTPIFALPYPLGTDPVADGDDSIKALAERVEALKIPSRRLYMATATTQNTTTTDTVWPAASAISVAIPTWAKYANVVYILTASYPSAASALGLYLTLNLGTVVGRTHVAQAPAGSAMHLVMSDELDVTALAGTTQTAQLKARHGGSVPYTVDGSGRITLDIEFTRR